MKYLNTKTVKPKSNGRSADITLANVVYGCPLNCGYCVIEGTLVATPFGLKRVEEIQEEDYIVSYNLDTLQPELDQVVDTFVRQSHVVYEINTVYGILLLTGEHLVYTQNRGWVKVKCLTLDDELLYDIRDLMEQYYIHNKDQFLKQYKTI